MIVAAVVDDVEIVPQSFVPSRVQFDEPPPPEYVPVTDHMLFAPSDMEMVVPLLMFSADRFVCDTGAIVCTPVK